MVEIGEKTRKMKLKGDEIVISANVLLNELMWPAQRYCIGRHTYVSSYAETYWHIIRRYREEFSRERLRFFARDIKDNIAQTMRWWNNLKIEGTGNDRIKYDPHYLLTRYMYEHPDTDFAATDFEIDCIAGAVVARNREKPLTSAEMAMARVPDCDLQCWSNLARSIDDTKSERLKDGSVVEVIDTYDEVRYRADEPLHWEKVLTLVENWRKIVPPEMIDE